MTGFLIAGSASGVGKTTVTLAIAAALRGRGRVVQLFKGGPDFLDTGHHSRVAGRRSRNLDTWMLSHETNREVLRRGAEGADVLIAEGMMGLFDGKHAEDEQGSSAEIAKLLKLPVVLVVDAAKSARSIAALVLGFETFDPELPLAGVIFNRVASERHFEMLEAAVVARCATPVLGWLPREPAVAIAERHLGLQVAGEQSDGDFERQKEALRALAEGHLRMDRICSLECGFDFDHATPRRGSDPQGVRIGVAWDAAFCFYYEDNLDLLRELGAEIVFFSPLTDSGLPPGLDALYLGGGYPELHAERLSENAAMFRDIQDFARALRPIYAECGGMMYLAASLTTKDGDTYAMAGVLPARVAMTAGLRRFGYVTVSFLEDCLLGPKGTVIRGHSFHYSELTAAEELSSSYRMDYSLSGRQEEEGYGVSGLNILASYVHLHFRANPVVAEHFIAAVTEVRNCIPGECTAYVRRSSEGVARDELQIPSAAPRNDNNKETELWRRRFV